MIYLLCAGLLVLYAATLVAGYELLKRKDRELERHLRAAEQERSQLLDRIMYQARQPWGGPPLEEPDWVPPERDYVYPESDLLE